MAINVSKLFKEYSFQQLDNNSKLLYIYLITNPNINTIGILSINIKVICLELNISIDELRTYTKQLIDDNYIYVKKINNIISYIIPNHFQTLPKSDINVEKTNKSLEELPDDVREFMLSLNIKPENKLIKFKKPTIEEIQNYANSIGYNIEAKTFYDYYENVSKGKSYWVDSNNKRIRDWKTKLRKIWCKEENKIVKNDSAPKGYEYLYVEYEDKKYYPKDWIDEQPHHPNMTINMLLKKEYVRLKGNS